MWPRAGTPIQKRNYRSGKDDLSSRSRNFGLREDPAVSFGRRFISHAQLRGMITRLLPKKAKRQAGWSDIMDGVCYCKGS